MCDFFQKGVGCCDLKKNKASNNIGIFFPKVLVNLVCLCFFFEPKNMSLNLGKQQGSDQTSD